MCVQCGEHFQRGRKIGTVKNISPSSGDKCPFPFQGNCKRREYPSAMGWGAVGGGPSPGCGQNEPFPGHPATRDALNWIHLFGQILLVMIFSVWFWWAFGRRDGGSVSLSHRNPPAGRQEGWRCLAWMERSLQTQPFLLSVQPWSLLFHFLPSYSWKHWQH